MTINRSCFGRNMQSFYASLCLKLVCLSRSICYAMLCFFRFVLLTANPFWIELCYFVLLSFLGFGFLKVLKPRTNHNSFRPRDLDLFFTSVSATTVSSMSTVEMEVFSNSQLIIITFLMLIGGEVFTSMAGLLLRKSKLKVLLQRHGEKVASVLSTSSRSSTSSSISSSSPETAIDTIELGVMGKLDHHHVQHDVGFDSQNLIILYHSIRLLGFVVLGYFVVVNGLGIALLSIYLSLVSSAREVLDSKGLKLSTFSVFTVISTFASCGFVPTNENMMVFTKNSALLLILIPQVLLGNTLFPSCLRFSLWVLGKFFKKEEFKYLLKNSNEIGYLHLLPRRHSSYLVVTVLGFIGVQLLMFCSMEWNSEALTGLNLNPWQKLVGILFQSVNTRHTGETIMDLSIISPPILVLLAFMMYLPPYTSFLLIKSEDWQNREGREERKISSRGKIVENLIFSQLSYLAIFLILICITEREKMKRDPLNFNVLNIAVEVISAYGNVGFTTGYSCKRQIKRTDNCEDKWYGFGGRWSDEGKIILIAVMFFGRLKKFNMQGGKSWKLL